MTTPKLKVGLIRLLYHKKQCETYVLRVKNEKSKLLREIQTLEINYNNVLKRLNNCEKKIAISVNEKEKTSNEKKGKTRGEEDTSFIYEKTEKTNLVSDIGTQAPESTKFSFSHYIIPSSDKSSEGNDAAKGVLFKTITII